MLGFLSSIVPAAVAMLALPFGLRSRVEEKNVRAVYLFHRSGDPLVTVASEYVLPIESTQLEPVLGTGGPRDPADDPTIRRGRGRRSSRSICERLCGVPWTSRRHHPPRPRPIRPGFRGAERRPPRILGGSDEPRRRGVPRDDGLDGWAGSLRPRQTRVRRRLELSSQAYRILANWTFEPRALPISLCV